MDTQLLRVVDASIQLELNVADLYGVFHTAFPQHAEFWWKILLEERNHAALIRSAKEQFAPVGKFPTDLITSQLSELTAVNSKLESLVEKYKHAAPSESEAFSVALLLEQSAGEVHYQKFMEADTDEGQGNSLSKIFQQLNVHDKDHAQRISHYMDSHGIAKINVSF